MIETYRRRGWAAVGGAALALAVLWAGVTSAGASETHLFKEIFGSTAKPSFTEANRLAVDRSDGDLLVLDNGAGTISRFNPDGTPADFVALGSNTIDGAGGADSTPEGGLEFGQVDRIQIAVDNSGTATDGNIYVTQRRNLSPSPPNPDFFAVYVFSTSGAYLGRLTGAGEGAFSDVSGVVVDSAGAVYVANAVAGKIHKFTPSANPPENGDIVAGFDANSPRNVVIGAGSSAGFLFAKASFGVGVSKIDSVSGAPAFAFLGGTASFRTGLAVDPSSGRIYAQTLTRAIEEWDASGASKPDKPVASFAIDDNLDGIAVADSGDLYLARENSDQIEVYGPTVTVPDVSTEVASEVARRTATLNGSVDADGVPLSKCLFEYGQGESYGQVAPCEPGAGEIGAGKASVKAELGGLELGAEYHYRLVAGNASTDAYGTDVKGEDEVFKLESPPVITGQWTVSAIASEAVLAASIVPEGFPSTYRFEYGLTSEYGQSTSAQPFGEDKSAHTVTAFIHDLQPGRTYHWRTVATNQVGEEEGAPALGPDRAFTTYASPQAPSPDSCPSAAYRISLGSYLPDCRAYELVSPIEKGGFDIRAGTVPNGIPLAINQSDPGGDKLTYTSNRPFCDAVSRPDTVQYMAGRGEEGWTCHALSPPRGVLRELFSGHNEFKAFSDDLCIAWLVNDRTTAPPPASGAVAEANNLLERSNCGAEGYRKLVAGEGAVPLVVTEGATLVGTEAADLLLFEGGNEPVAVCVLPDRAAPTVGCAAGMAKGEVIYESSVTHSLSADGSHVYFTDRGSGPGALYLRRNPSVSQSPLEHGAATGRGDLEAGSATVANVATESDAFEVGQTITARRGIPFGTTIVSCAPACGPGATSLTLSAAASQSESAMKMSAFSKCTDEAKACTVPVSESVSPNGVNPELTTQRATFWGASADGSAALFSLDPDRASNTNNGPESDALYRFEDESETASPIVPDFLGVLGASTDLSRVYLASEALCSDDEENARRENNAGDVAVKGEPNLYLYEAGQSCEEGEFAFIGTLADEDAGLGAINRSPVSLEPALHTARVSPDGATAAFVSYASLTGYDNTDVVGGVPDAELFRYSAGSGELKCISCNPSGARPRGRLVDPPSTFIAPYWAAAQIAPAQTSLHYPKMLSQNGNRVFFESFEQLVLRDVNNALDLYQWEAAGEGTCTETSPTYVPANSGCVDLISSGQNAKDAAFLDASADGSTVFFTTEASLLPQDPGLIDIYAARIDGGFPPPAPPAAPCEGEACQSAPPSPPLAKRSSSSFRGAGDRARSACTGPARKAKRLARRARALRQAAKRSAKPKRTRALRRKAARAARRARRQSKGAKRCRAKARRQRSAR